MRFVTVDQFALTLMTLHTISPDRLQVVDLKLPSLGGPFVPYFTTEATANGYEEEWYTIRPELAVTPGEIKFMHNAGGTDNEYQPDVHNVVNTYLTYTVAPGLGYGALISFSDNERDIWGDWLRDCRTQDEFELEARVLLVRCNYARTPVLKYLPASVFTGHLMRLRQMLAKTYDQYPNLDTELLLGPPGTDEVSDAAIRQITSQYNQFFDQFYAKLEEYQYGMPKGVSLLTQEDIHVTIPRLKRAYRIYVGGWVSKLNLYVTYQLQNALVA